MDHLFKILNEESINYLKNMKDAMFSEKLITKKFMKCSIEYLKFKKRKT
jgi:hypothetical protein